jgi:NADH-quinone oxidoreductase subunit C
LSDGRSEGAGLVGATPAGPLAVDELAARVRAAYPDVVVARDEVTVIVARDALRACLGDLRSDAELQLGFLSCVTATDHPGADPRVWVIYELRSIERRHRLRVKVGLSEGDLRIPSITDLFPTADWQEREVYDFYGVVFDGHPDLTRILLPDDWEGFPLRKDEELGGVNTRYVGAFIPPIDERGMA